MTRPPREVTTVVEGPRRLSESVIWKLQRAFYATQGPQAWTPRRIPFWASSNTFFARGVARVVLAFLRDLAAGAAGAGFDRTAPLYVVELASGSGQFAFFFLRRLLELKRTVPGLAGLDVRYVLTDFTDNNVEAWRSHERFRPLVEQGLLDFALFDLERDHELRLVGSGQTLSASTLVNPLVVLANYAFDSTLQDCFLVRHGTLLQDLVTTVVAGKEAPDLAEAGLLERLRLRFEAAPMEAAYYDDPLLNRVVQTYGATLDDTAFLFPIGALGCVRRLLDLSGHRLLLVCGDKGVTHEEELMHRRDPVMTRHGGSFSFIVNLHAIGRYFEEAGGLALHTAQHAPGLQVSCFLSGFPAPSVPETKQAFRSEIEEFGPGEFFTLVRNVCQHYTTPTLDVLLALLRLTDGDPDVLYMYREQLVKQARDVTPSQRHDLRHTLAQAWSGFYPLHKDLAVQLARVSIALSLPEDAVHYCEESLRLFGESQAALVVLGYGYALQGHHADGMRCVERALALGPEYGPALELKALLQRAPAG